MLHLTLKENKKYIKETITYPCLRKFYETQRDSQFIVLFGEEGKLGTVIYAGNDSTYEVGDKYGGTAEASELVTFEGEVVLKQS